MKFKILGFPDREGAPVEAPGSARPDLGRRVEHGADDLVVAGAAAQVAGQPVAHLGLARLRVALEQRLGGDQEAVAWTACT